MIWRPGRIRVYTRHGENPWSRTGSIARDHRAFLQGLGGPDRQEEDEDWEVVAPLRPTRRWAPGGEPWAFAVDEELFASLSVELPDLETEREPLPDRATVAERRQRARDAAAAKRIRTEKRRSLKAQPWRVTLERESNFRLLSELDARLLRTSDGHCLWIQEHWSQNPGRLSMIDTKGFTRSLTIKQAVLVLERGDITKETRMTKDCDQVGCLAPDHHVIE